MAELDLDRVLCTLPPALEPPMELRARTLEAVAAETPAPPKRRVRRRSFRLAFAGVAAALAVTIAVVVVLRDGGGDAIRPELVAQLRGPDASARAIVTKTGIGRVIDFRSDELPILPTGMYYELWFVGPGDRPGARNRISAGTFHPDEQGRSRVTFAAAVDPQKYPVLVVTAEPGDGDPRPSRTEVVRSAPTP